MTLEYSEQFFQKYSNIKFQKNTFSGSPVVPRGRKDGQTWRSLIVVFRNFAKAPKRGSWLSNLKQDPEKRNYLFERYGEKAEPNMNKMKGNSVKRWLITETAKFPLC